MEDDTVQTIRQLKHIFNGGEIEDSDVRSAKLNILQTTSRYNELQLIQWLKENDIGRRSRMKENESELNSRQWYEGQ